MKLHLRNTVLLLALFVGLCLTSCSQKDTEVEKHPDFSKNVIDVSSQIVPIQTDAMFGENHIDLIGDFLILTDVYSLDTGFLFFDKNTFAYIGSGGKKGQGPGEIIKYKNTHIAPVFQDKNSFLVFDYSQLVTYKYNIDSLLKEPQYLPEKIFNMAMQEIYNNVTPLNDSIYLGMGLRTTSYHSFISEVMKININRGKAEPFGYKNPKIAELGGNNTHSKFTASIQNNLFVQTYLNQDVMTLCDLKGNLICDVYGPLWTGEKNNDFGFYSKVQILNDCILASYKGEKGMVLEQNKRPRGKFAEKILVFDLQGNYLKTLVIGEEMKNFCVDEENNRLIISFLERDEPLAYLDLNGLLD